MYVKRQTLVAALFISFYWVSSSQIFKNHPKKPTVRFSFCPEYA
jgi:hypothetical protein